MVEDGLGAVEGVEVGLVGDAELGAVAADEGEVVAAFSEALDRQLALIVDGHFGVIECQFFLLAANF